MFKFLESAWGSTLLVSGTAGVAVYAASESWIAAISASLCSALTLATICAEIENLGKKLAAK